MIFSYIEGYSVHVIKVAYNIEQFNIMKEWRGNEVIVLFSFTSS